MNVNSALLLAGNDPQGMVDLFLIRKLDYEFLTR